MLNTLSRCLVPSWCHTLTQVYAVATGLCVASAKALQPSRDRGGDDRDGNDTLEEATDDAVDPTETGPSFGRLVVDGCCHAFAEALNMVRIRILTTFFILL